MNEPIKLTLLKHGSSTDTVVYSWFPEEMALLDENGRPLVFSDEYAAGIQNYISQYNYNIMVVRVGEDCNFNCAYCCQGQEHSKQFNASEEQVETFIASLKSYFSRVGGVKQVVFIGGEPLLYWDSIVRIMKGLRELDPRTRFNVTTNGSLLTEAHIADIKEYGVIVGISHDGPANRFRTWDILAPGSDSLDVIKKLYAETKDRELVHFVATFNAHSPSHRKVAEYFTKTMNSPDVSVGEGYPCWPFYGVDAFSDLYVPAHKLPEFAGTLLSDLIDPKIAAQYKNCFRHVNSFIYRLMKQEPIKPSDGACGIFNKFIYTADISGEVNHCYNYSGDYIIPHTRVSNFRGYINDVDNLRPISALSWADRKQCKNCPVLPLCRGACPLVEEQYFDSHCEARFWHNFALLGLALYSMTGNLLLGANGDFHRRKVVV